MQIQKAERKTMTKVRFLSKYLLINEEVTGIDGAHVDIRSMAWAICGLSFNKILDAIAMSVSATISDSAMPELGPIWLSLDTFKLFTDISLTKLIISPSIELSSFCVKRCLSMMPALTMDIG